jgi:hypothetical protein
MGEMLQPSSIDLLAGPAMLPDGDGITGTYRSATFSFDTPSADPALDLLAGAAAVVEGTAAKTTDAGAETVNFRITADRDQVAAQATNAALSGCDFDDTTVAGDGVVAIALAPRFWLNLVDFTGLPAGTPEAPTVIAAGTTPHIAFEQGLAQLGAYSFTFTAATNP